MILDNDTTIESRIDSETKLFETFIKQRRLRCDLAVCNWRFEFLILHKDTPKALPTERYIYVTNYRDPDNVSKEFAEALGTINKLYYDYEIIPLYL